MHVPGCGGDFGRLDRRRRVGISDRYRHRGSSSYIFWVRILDDGTACLAFCVHERTGTHAKRLARQTAPDPTQCRTRRGLVGGGRGVDPRASGAMCLGGLVVSSAARA